jgi:hypothetical protein
MAAVTFKDVSDYLSFKQRKESDKGIVGEWAQLEELYNKKWVHDHKLIIPDFDIKYILLAVRLFSKN